MRHHLFEPLLVVLLFFVGATLLAIGTEPYAILLGLIILISALILTAYIVRKHITTIAIREIEEAWSERRKSENTLRKEIDTTHRAFVETRDEYINLRQRYSTLLHDFENTTSNLREEVSRRSEIERQYNKLEEKDIERRINVCNDLLQILSEEIGSVSLIDHYKEHLSELQDYYEEVSVKLDKMTDDIRNIYLRERASHRAADAAGPSPTLSPRPRNSYNIIAGGNIVEGNITHIIVTSEGPDSSSHIFTSDGAKASSPYDVTTEHIFENAHKYKAEAEVKAERKSLFDTGKLVSFFSHILSAHRSHRIKMSRVDFSAVAPKSFPLGRVSIVDLILYESNARNIVDEILSNQDNLEETKAGDMVIEEGTKIRVVVTSSDISLNYSEERTWNGNYLHFTVPVRMPITYYEPQILFEAEIYVGGFRATGLCMTADCTAPAKQLLSITRNDVRTAFASYSRKNQKQVFAAVQAMRKCLPELDVFVDKESLKSGEYWKEKLMREIDKRDVLYLFWSQAASESSWVEREWRYAFNIKGLNGIEPFPLEKIPPCPSPPNELKDKNFTDVLINML